MEKDTNIDEEDPKYCASHSSPSRDYSSIKEDPELLPSTNPIYTSLSEVRACNRDKSYYETCKRVVRNQSKKEKGFCPGKCMCIVSVFVIMLSLCCLISCFAFVSLVIETASLKSQLSLVQQQLNVSALDEHCCCDNDNMTIQQAVRDNEHNISELKMLVLDTLQSLKKPSSLASSCASLLASSPSTPSGHYWIKVPKGSAVRMYCDMTRSCGGVTGGWTRVAELDTSSTTQCPGDLRYLDDTFTNNVSVCGIEPFRFGHDCSPATFNLSGILYSRVCGRIKAYKFGTPEAFHPTKDIDSVYVDGISLTHGNPRQHIWTFAADSNTNSANCPCSSSHQTTPTPSQDFVGEDYFCNTASDDSSRTYHFDNPVWDGDGCIPGNMCCSFNSPPWFYKQLPRPTTDDIEMRVCADQLRGDEDIGIESLEIYVR